MIYNRITKKTFSPADSVLDYFWLCGDEKNPPLLFLPGYTGTHKDLVEMAESLKKNYFVLIPDLPGWGDSQPLYQRLTLEAYSDYLDKLIKFVGMKNIIVCGHCMGATLGIELAYKYPDKVKELFLISTPYIHNTLSEALFLHLADLSERSPRPLKSFFFLWRARVFSVPLSFFILKFHSLRKLLRITFKTAFSQSRQDEKAVEENWISLIHFDYKKIAHLAMPVNLIYGEEDLIIGKKQAYKLHELIPDSKLYFIPHSGHLPPVETPKALASYIAKSIIN